MLAPVLRKILVLPLLAAAVGLTLAGCGQAPIKMGAAAIVAEDRISTAEVQDAVRAFREAHARTPIPPTQLVLPDPQSLPRSELMLLLRFHITEQAAHRQGVTVSDAEVQDFIAAGGGRESLQTRALVGGIPPSLLDDAVREALIRQRLADEIAPGAGRTQADQEVQRYLSDFAGEAGVTVSPRYGRFDYDALLVRPAENTLSRPDDPRSG